jgi:hypothetical protein
MKIDVPTAFTPPCMSATDTLTVLPLQLASQSCNAQPAGILVFPAYKLTVHFQPTDHPLVLIPAPLSFCCNLTLHLVLPAGAG